MPIQVQVGPGELIDRLTVLEVKAQRFEGRPELEHIRQELSQLRSLCEAEIPARPDIAMLRGQLKAVNEALWETREALGEMEKQQDFSPRFIELARAVHQNGTRRTKLRAQIDAELAGMSPARVAQ